MCVWWELVQQAADLCVALMLGHSSPQRLVDLRGFATCVLLFKFLCFLLSGVWTIDLWVCSCFFSVLGFTIIYYHVKSRMLVDADILIIWSKNEISDLKSEGLHTALLVFMLILNWILLNLSWTKPAILRCLITLWGFVIRAVINNYSILSFHICRIQSLV